MSGEDLTRAVTALSVLESFDSFSPHYLLFLVILWPLSVFLNFYYPYLSTFKKLCLERESKVGREEGEERENNDWLPSCTYPKWGSNLQPGYVP